MDTESQAESLTSGIKDKLTPQHMSHSCSFCELIIKPRATAHRQMIKSQDISCHVI